MQYNISLTKRKYSLIIFGIGQNGFLGPKKGLFDQSAFEEARSFDDG